MCLNKHTCMRSCAIIYRGVTIRVRDEKKWELLHTKQSMLHVLLLWVTTDNLSVATKEETAATCGYLMQRLGPSHGGAVQKLLFNDGRLGQ